MVLGEVIGIRVRRCVRRRASMRPRVGSRGSEREGVQWIRGKPASMRPRVGSRGSDTSDLRAGGQLLGFNEAPSWFSGKCTALQRLGNALQRFNEAPSWFSGKFRRLLGVEWHPHRASMRPRVGSRGSLGVEIVTSGVPPASMRPRVGSRGSRMNAKEHFPPVPASMRPRVGSRGSFFGILGRSQIRSERLQ